MTTGRIEVGPTGRTVAANVKRLREGRGLTLRALSAALKDNGRPLSADALNKIENGDGNQARGVRRVDVDDLVALAVALDVSPLALLLPHDARGVAEITGAGEVDGRDAWSWGRSMSPLRHSTVQDQEERERGLMAFHLASSPVGITKQSRQRLEAGDDGPSLD
ncbi:helix-turn-helix transcriptional regulator [Streptomyces kunmingensis]|uniref:Helix-turn-helix transcriptional regulator n=1 Tax=Streptomyces kunmingensis TaxID=68225 RepID=A0ABU6CNE7_9ACTN|nr:helix-turn-helix transcriptional regulator [Streptomyces kunmingensis]MEB3966254.1 helix-turn-helix transcriptional regulator [Streptomyces kunmingensis]